ncbi:MAG: GntR family transcriptional regulator [Moraxellaceae bacterium]|nr:GntR family transcriptional regulator [Moraxellaceae bacterium]
MSKNDEVVQTRSQTVISTLRERLLRGDFEPEERLQEVALAESLGVSRTPVREALRTLAEEGLVIYATNRGYRARGFSLDYIMKAFRLRMALEGLGARLAAEKPLTPVARESFQRPLAEGDTLLQALTSDGFDHEAWRLMNKAFHLAVHQHADNELLLQTAAWSARIPVVIAGAFRWYVPTDYRRSHDQHHRIFDAIEKGQSDRADHLMQEHIYEASEIIAANYREPSLR